LNDNLLTFLGKGIKYKDNFQKIAAALRFLLLSIEYLLVQINYYTFEFPPIPLEITILIVSSNSLTASSTCFLGHPLSY